MLTAIQTLVVAFFALLSPQSTGGLVVPQVTRIEESRPIEKKLASREISLAARHANSQTNEVFKKNILLNLAYLNQAVEKKSDIQWEHVLQNQSAEFTLQPGQVFAYHDDVLPEFDGSVAVTTNAHFDASEGFLSSGFLSGDGVCHLASVINWAARDAGLDVTVTKLHSIARIPEIPDEYGVSIYTIAGQKGSGARNNLYVRNNRDAAVSFRLTYDGSNQLKIEVLELPSTLAFSPNR